MQKIEHEYYHNPSLGLTTKARACKVASQEKKLGNERNCEGMNPHTPKGASTLGVGVSMDSWRTPECSESNCKGQKSMDWRVFYIIEKILKLRCIKWARMTHLDIWNTSYGQKKGQESNWQFDSWPLKVKNRPNFLMYRWRATYYWKALDKGYKFTLDLISIRGLHAKLWGPKVMGVLTLGISKLPFGSLGTKCHLDLALVEKHRVYYKGEGGGFPPPSLGRGESCESKFARGSS